MKFWYLQISQKTNQILDRFLNYEARPEIYQRFGWLFERFEGTKISLTDLYIHTKVHTGKYLCSCKVQPLNDDWVSFPIISHRPQPLKLNFLSSLKWMWNCIFPPLPSYVSSPSSPVLPHSTVLRFVHLCLVWYIILFVFWLSIS